MSDLWEQAETPEAEVLRRLALAEALTAKDGKALRAGVYARCARDFDFWRRNFVWLADPDGNEIPSMSWEYQTPAQRLYIGLDGIRPPMVLAKGRELGATHSLAIEAGLWIWLFMPNKVQILLSRTEADVDDCSDVYGHGLFPKLRFVLQRLPLWMLPKAHRRDGKARGFDRHKMLINPSNGSSFLGLATNAEAARSKRAWRVFIDEANMIPFLERMVRSVSRTGPFCAVSSVGGRHTHFARLWHGDVQPLSEDGGNDKKLVALRWHYSMRPDWGPEKIADMKAAMDATSWAQEMEVDFFASTPGRIWGGYVTDYHRLTPEKWWEMREEAVAGIPIHAWDFGQTASLTAWLSTVWLPERKGGTLLIDDFKQWSDTPADEVAAELRAAGWYDGREPDYCVGDPSGEAWGSKTWNGARTSHVGSWISNLSEQGVFVSQQTIEIERAIAHVGRLLREGRILLSPRVCERQPQHPNWPCALEAFTGYRRKESDPEAWERNEPPRPVKDIYSHLADCLQHAVWRSLRI